MNNQMNNYNGYNQNFNNKKDSKEKLIISILGLAILIVAIIGISFAAYRLSLTTKNASSISTTPVEVSFTESDNAVDLNNAMPVSDNTGKSMEDNSFDFSVTTSAGSDISVPYKISITTDNNNTLEDSFVKVYLLRDNEEIVKPILVSNLPIYSHRADSKILYETVDKFSSKKDNKTTHYTLKVWVDQDFDISNSDSKTFSLKVNVDSAMNE